MTKGVRGRTVVIRQARTKMRNGRAPLGLDEGVLDLLATLYGHGRAGLAAEVVATLREYPDPQWQARLQEIETQGVVLDIPFLPQVGEGANWSRNDCGPACVAMLANWIGRAVTVDEAAQACQQVRNQYTTFAQLLQGLRTYALPATYKRPLSVAEIAAYLQQGRPCLVLIDYRAWPLQLAQFDGWHFVLVVGVVEDTFIVHDPLTPMGGSAVVRAADLAHAMQSGRPGNMPRQGIVIQGV